jgi:cobalamin synthase
LVALGSWAIIGAIISLLAGNQAVPTPLVAIIPTWFAVPASAALAAAFVAKLYERGVGGYTGDALGAAVELGELCHLTLAAWILTLLA